MPRWSPLDPSTLHPGSVVTYRRAAQLTSAAAAHVASALFARGLTLLDRPAARCYVVAFRLTPLSA